MESQMDYEQTNGAAQLGPDDGIETSRSEAWTCNGFAPVTYFIMPPWPRMRAG
jgi:hypothetical protein